MREDIDRSGALHRFDGPEHHGRLAARRQKMAAADHRGEIDAYPLSLRGMGLARNGGGAPEVVDKKTGRIR